MRHDPKPKIISGTTEPKCGPSQRTKERIHCKKSHVDWWIYSTAFPSNFEFVED